MTAAPTKATLAALSLADLRELAEVVADLIAEKGTAEKATLAAEIEQLAKDRGFAVADVLALFSALPAARTPEKPKGKGSKGGRGSVAPKYRNPADPSQTWSGRGRQPVWVSAHIANGGKLEDVAIPAA